MGLATVTKGLTAVSVADVGNSNHALENDFISERILLIIPTFAAFLLRMLKVTYQETAPAGGGVLADTNGPHDALRHTQSSSCCAQS